MGILWPKRKNWVAMAIPAPYESDIHNSPVSNPNNAWRSDEGRWSNGKKMVIGDWYELRLDKPRSLSEITVRSEGQRFPKKIKFLIKENWRDDWELKTEEVIDVKPHNEATTFCYRFGKHQKVEAIKLEIVEPTLEPRNVLGMHPAWAIYNIDFKEYYFWGLLERHIK